MLYGSSVGGIANTLNITVEEAEKLVAMYFDTFPGVKTYIEQTHAAALHNQFVTTPFGHRRQFYGTKPFFKGTAAYNAALRGSQNYVIQSSTSVIGAIVFSQINREIRALGGLCTATVHDSLEAEVPIEHAARALEIFYYYMNDWPQTQYEWLGLSIGCDGEVGWNWAGVESVHRGTSQEEIVAMLTKQIA
ncbi:MAG TPA: DNA polymerase [Methanosarcina sp.]|nr:DNA polymerase [Methanosarcina sp.]